MSVGEQLQALLARHCASLATEIPSIGKMLSKAMLVTGERYRELMSETVEMVHRMNGSSGSLGFLALGAAACKLEDIMNESMRSTAGPEEADIRELHRLFLEMKTIAEQTKPEDSHLFGIDLNQVG